MATTDAIPAARKAIDLQLGWPSPYLFPATAISQAAGGALSTDALIANALIYGPEAGEPRLRENLASFLSDFYQPSAGPISPDRIFVTNGASGALSSILSRFTDPAVTRRVWMVEPTYFLACPTFQDFGFNGRLRGVPEDDEGIDLAYLRRGLEEVEKVWQPADARAASTPGIHGARAKVYKHVIYAVPTFSNPSGKVMSLRRREELVQLAREFDALIVTDDVYDMLRWPAEEGASGFELPPPPPRLVDIDRSLPGTTQWGNTLSNGSVSKILAPGMRVGWVEGPPDAVMDLCNYGAMKSSGNQAHFSSLIIDQMLSSGVLLSHIREVLVPTYQKRYYAMVRLVKKHLGPLGVNIDTCRPSEQQETKENGMSNSLQKDILPVKKGQLNGNTNGNTNGDVAGALDHPNSDAGVYEKGESMPTLAGGFFMYLRFPRSLPPLEQIAKQALEQYDLRIAHGMMGIVEGDEEGQTRAREAFGQCARLCWSWHTEDEIEEGIKRLATILREY
ncbi:PLP-dependent transferase [Thozetella sp. PMI_491]|nr:PLP-dependent transferase [Thozetella sp. PMI_491]